MLAAVHLLAMQRPIRHRALRCGRTNFVQLLMVQKHTALPVLTHLQVLLAVLGTEASLKRVNCKTQVGEIGKWCNVK